MRFPPDRRAIILLWVLLALVAFSRGAGATGPQGLEWGLSVREAACAAGERVLLGEVAAPFGPLPQAQWHELAATPLWPAPEREGRTYVLSQRQLAGLFKHYLGEDAQRVSLPATITVRRGGAVLTPTHLRKAIEDALRPQLAAMEGRTELGELAFPKSVFLDKPWARLKVEAQDSLRPGRLSVRVAALAGDGREMRRLTVTGQVHQWVAVACATRPVNAGETVTPELITFKEKNLAHGRGRLWDGRGGPWRLTRPVGAGQPFYRDWLETVPAVTKGAHVTLTFAGSHVNLSIPAQALKDGAVGEAIPVKNLSSGRTVYAVVLREDTVAVK